jgi:type IV pilus biogenesis protein CpaD/CtpE
VPDLHPRDPRTGGESAPVPSSDLHAFREATARDLPPLEQHVTTIRSRRLAAAHSWRERFMSLSQLPKSRPWLASGVAVVALAVAMLVIPISYQRTTGHHVALTISGMSDAQMRAVASELKALLHSNDVALQARNENGTPVFELETSVPTTAGVDAAAVAQAFAKNLTARGYRASAVTSPIRERVSGSVYAYAKDLVIKVSTDGKSSAQIEAEIRQRLAEAGITDAQVSVTDEDGNARKVKLEVKRTAEDKTPESNISLQLTRDGKALAGPGLTIEIRKTRTSSGVTVHLDVNQSGKKTSIEIANADAMTDAALKAEIESRLRQAGIDAQVTVTNGQIGIEAAKH